MIPSVDPKTLPVEPFQALTVDPKTLPVEPFQIFSKRSPLRNRGLRV